jgi:hypothetical protein
LAVGFVSSQVFSLLGHVNAASYLALLGIAQLLAYRLKSSPPPRPAIRRAAVEVEMPTDLRRFFGNA